MSEHQDPLTPGISIVVPVYNSEATLAELVARLGCILPQISDQFEVLLVNDASQDTSWQTICKLAQQYDWVKGINLMRNYGQHNALLCGIRVAMFDTIVTMDDDLQHPPEEIPKLLDKLAEGCDVVFGFPRILPHSWWRNVSSKVTKRILARALGLYTIRDFSAFRAFRSDLRRAFAHFRGPQLFLDALLSWGTARFGGVQINHSPRHTGKSNYTFPRLFNQALLVLTGFSTAPLRLATLNGLAFTLFGVFILMYVVLRYLLSGSVPGFPFLASIISIFSGVQLFTLGVIGEYLAGIFIRSLERPTYVVSGTTTAQIGFEGVRVDE
jgi:glycosyltransferase involved in cell wall biosynthesis